MPRWSPASVIFDRCNSRAQNQETNPADERDRLEQLSTTWHVSILQNSANNNDNAWVEGAGCYPYGEINSNTNENSKREGATMPSFKSFKSGLGRARANMHASGAKLAFPRRLLKTTWLGQAFESDKRTPKPPRKGHWHLVMLQTTNL
jgi:hypothetical protein